MKLQITLLVSLVAAAFATPASAFSLLTKGGACPNGIRWAADASLEVSTFGVPVAEVANLVTSVDDIRTRINRVNGQWFDYTGSVVGTAGAQSLGNGDNEVAMPSIDGKYSILAVALTDVNLATCTIIEADVRVDLDDDWLYGVPANHGQDYFNASKSIGGEYYIRPVLLHELLHTVGFAHSDHSYSFMNYGNKAWENRLDPMMASPLPDDREGLRSLYPDTSTEKDIATLVTWYDPTVVTNGAATQALLCKPSTGTAYSPSVFDSTCGITAVGANGSTSVCPGDTVYFRYALANFGTIALTTTEEAWLSSDAVLNPVADILARTYTAQIIGAQSSKRMGRTLTVPTGVILGASYYLIVEADTGVDMSTEESAQNNWIPLLAPITIKSVCP